MSARREAGGEAERAAEAAPGADASAASEPGATNATPEADAAPDYIALAGAKSLGQRPWFLENRDAERVLQIALALAQELSVTRDRLDTLERLLEAHGVLKREEIESFVPSQAASAERIRKTREYIATILRVVQQELEAAAAGETDPAVEQVSEELARR